MFNKLILCCICFMGSTCAHCQLTNDDCGGATFLTLTAGHVCTTGTTLQATPTNWVVDGPCGENEWNDVWYTFVSTGTINTITVQPTGGAPAKKLGIAVFTGASCSVVINGTNNCNITATDTAADTVIQVGAAGTQYFVEIGAFNGNGDFNLCVNSITPGNVPGSACNSALQLCNTDSFTLAAMPNGNGTFTPGCFDEPALSSIWYQFTVADTGLLSWNCKPIAGNTELDWALYNVTSGCPGIGNYTLISCNFHFAKSTSSPIGMSDTSTTVCPTDSNNTFAWQEYCPATTIYGGNTYAIFINNYSNNQSGLNFNFNGSTFTMAGLINEMSANICTAGSYNFNSQNLTQSGIYRDTFQTTSGCDSINILHLTISNVLQSAFSQSICTGDSFAFKNKYLKQPGIYIDTLQAQGGCDSIVTLNLSVNNISQTSFTDSFCQGAYYYFNGHYIAQPGVYTSTLQTVNGCDSLIILTLLMDSSPAPSIVAGTDSLQTQTFAFYQWLLNGTPVNGATGQGIPLTQSGSYTVSVTNANGCTTTSAPFVVTGIAQGLQTSSGLNVYPNPGKGNFTLGFFDNAVREISVTNMLGQPVAPVVKVMQKSMLDLSALPDGIYILKATNIQNNNNVIFKQIVVAK